MDMKRLSKLSFAVGCFSVSTACIGASAIADGRGNGMGNAGVTSADYLLAPFYNPALTAVHRDSDTIGILVPAIGASVRDTDGSLDTIDELQSVFDDFENSGQDPAIATKLNNYLNDLSDDKPLAATAGAGIAVALPIQALSANIYTRGYAEIVAESNIAQDNGDDPIDVENRYRTSNVDMIAFGYTEFGVALAKRMTVQGQDVAFGVTPKYQQLRTYKQNLSVDDFDISDYDESETNKNAFNMDLGAIWFYDAYRVGIAVKDLFSKKIDTLDVGSGTSTYKLNTQVTVSGSYAMDYFVATADLDLTKQERFTDLNDDTQYLRLGIEGNAFGWAQLRAGYEMDLESTLDDSVTFGIGISPGDLVSFDLAGSYAGSDQFGLSGNLAFTF